MGRRATLCGPFDGHHKPCINPYSNERIQMKAVFLGGALAILLASSAGAQTYNAGGFTIHVPRGCKSASCVSVDSDEYGVHQRGTGAKSRKAKAATKKDDAASANAPASTAAAPPATAAPVAPVTTTVAPAPAVGVTAAAPGPVAPPAAGSTAPSASLPPVGVPPLPTPAATGTQTN